MNITAVSVLGAFLYVSRLDGGVDDVHRIPQHLDVLDAPAEASADARVGVQYYGVVVAADEQWRDEVQ